MSEKHFKKFSRTGREFTLAITDLPNSIFAMAVHKAGSALFDNLLREIAKAAGHPACDFDPQLFAQGVADDELSLENLSVLEQRGILFYGFRSLTNLLNVDNFHRARKLILVRDPRDIAVSFYFSTMISHPLPKAGPDRERLMRQRAEGQTKTASDFVLDGQADKPLANLRAYIELARTDANIKFYRYEDVVFGKRQWVDALCRDLGIKLAKAKRWEIADRHDVLPDDEDPRRHVRQVTPGNHKKHLNREAIDRLERSYSDVMDYFGYATSLSPREISGPAVSRKSEG